MDSATLHVSGLSTARRPGVGEALHGLAVAAQGVVVALWAAVSPPPRTVQAPLTAFEEAENVRAIAFKWLRSDPRFAQELYCAADRHEQASRKASPSGL